MAALWLVSLRVVNGAQSLTQSAWEELREVRGSEQNSLLRVSPRTFTLDLIFISRVAA